MIQTPIQNKMEKITNKNPNYNSEKKTIYYEKKTNKNATIKENEKKKT